jgi:CRISPR/Cas system-associated protein endoribonuclease Cas2
MNLEAKQQKLDQVYMRLINKFDQLYEIYEYDVLVNAKKACQKNYEQIKKDIVKTGTVNYLYFYEIYIKLIETETGIQFMDNKSKSLCASLGLSTLFVSQNKYRWIKIIGGNVNRIDKSLDYDFYGNFSILDVIEKFKATVTESIHLPFSETPELIVMFHEKPNNEVCEEITNLGITIKTINDIPLLPLNIKQKEIDTVNLDITTLITLCSEVTNLTDTNIQISDRIKSKLTTAGFNSIEQLIEYKNKLYQDLIKYKNIIVCQSAWNTFVELVTTNGGSNEKARVANIKEIVTIVPDHSIQQYWNLSKSKNNLYKTIFGTGEANNAITYSGNITFIDKLKSCGIHLIYQEHKSFQLTEKVLCV